MTEAEWQTTDDVRSLLAHTEPTLSVRKGRLIGVAACRTIEHVLHPRVVHVLSDADRFAERPGVTMTKTRRRFNLGSDLWHGVGDHRPTTAVWMIYYGTPTNVLTNLGMALGITSHPEYVVRHPEFAAIVRDVAGNPFRPPVLPPGSRTSSAVALARTMYDARDFTALPVLADALEEAGCDDPALLAHCRDTHHPHVRGCWAVDLVLGLS